MAIPNLQHIVEQCKNENPAAWSNAHTGNAHTEDFIRLLVPMLQAEDSRFALNGKRGNPNDISDDAVNVLCDAEDSEGRTPDGEPCAVVDVIAGAGGSTPAPAWSVFTTEVEGSGANVQPGPPPAPEVPPFPPRDETLNAGMVFNEDYRRRGAAANGTLGGRFEAIVRHIDFEGEVIWCSEYLRRRQLGETDQQAIDNVLVDIGAAWPK